MRSIVFLTLLPAVALAAAGKGCAPAVMARHGAQNQQHTAPPPLGYSAETSGATKMPTIGSSSPISYPGSSSTSRVRFTTEIVTLTGPCVDEPTSTSSTAAISTKPTTSTSATTPMITNIICNAYGKQPGCSTRAGTGVVPFPRPTTLVTTGTGSPGGGGVNATGTGGYIVPSRSPTAPSGPVVTAGAAGHARAGMGVVGVVGVVAVVARFGLGV